MVEAGEVTDDMIMAAATALAGLVTADRLATGALYPPIAELRLVTRTVAGAVARQALADGVARMPAGTDLEAAVDAAIWRPAYVPYTPLSAAG